ncbi:hypothetical protein BDW72DRAFT_164693 [Aspergillus terricola var. indicus]
MGRVIPAEAASAIPVFLTILDCFPYGKTCADYDRGETRPSQKAQHSQISQTNLLSPRARFQTPPHLHFAAAGVDDLRACSLALSLVRHRHSSTRYNVSIPR